MPRVVVTVKLEVPRASPPAAHDILLLVRLIGQSAAVGSMERSRTHRQINVDDQAQGRGTDRFQLLRSANAIRCLHDTSIGIHRGGPQRQQARSAQRTDWRRSAFSGTQQNNNLAAPVAQADPDRLWGTPGSSRHQSRAGHRPRRRIGAVVWDRESARITFNESGLSDDGETEMFTKNQIRFRGEERIAFGVERPAAFCSLTGM